MSRPDVLFVKHVWLSMDGPLLRALALRLAMPRLACSVETRIGAATCTCSRGRPWMAGSRRRRVGSRSAGVGAWGGGRARPLPGAGGAEGSSATPAPAAGGAAPPPGAHLMSLSPRDAAAAAAQGAGRLRRCCGRALPLVLVRRPLRGAHAGPAAAARGGPQQPPHCAAARGGPARLGRGGRGRREHDAALCQWRQPHGLRGPRL